MARASSRERQQVSSPVAATTGDVSALPHPCMILGNFYASKKIMAHDTIKKIWHYTRFSQTN